MNSNSFNGRILSTDSERQRMAHFHALTFEEQGRAIRRLSATLSPHGIASATKLSVEAVYRVLNDSQQEAA